MIGMPISAIVLPTGRGVGKAFERMSATRVSPAPVSITAGMTFMCTDVPRKPLAMCGATIPTKPSGPQNAVTAPAIRQLPIIAMPRIREMSAPAKLAYSSPKRAMSSPLLLI